MKRSAQVIDPRQAGHLPPAMSQPVFGPEALARAEKALGEMSGSFEQWLEADIAKLQAARAAAAAAEWCDASLDAVWRASHDLKGMGGTYGYPIVTQLAASLCRLTETDAGKAAARADTELVEAHVDALRAAVRDRIATEEHPSGGPLLRALEERVRMLGVAPR